LHVRLPDRDRPSGDHFDGTYVPVEEPSTASIADIADLLAIPARQRCSALGWLVYGAAGRTSYQSDDGTKCEAD
jgi:hypothetical protein